MSQENLEVTEEEEREWQQRTLALQKNSVQLAENVKTGLVYHVLGEVFNATNAQEGQSMILYQTDDGHLFVRETSEFNIKFRRIDDRRVSDERQGSEAV